MSNNSNLVPKRQFGAITVKNCTGGEIDLDAFKPDLSIEDVPIEQFKLFKTSDVRKYAEDLKEQLMRLRRPQTKVANRASKIEIKDERRKALIKILNQRAYKGPRFDYSKLKLISFEHKYETVTRLPMINQKIDYEVEKKVIEMNNKVDVFEKDKIYRHVIDGNPVYSTVVEKKISFGDKSTKKEDRELTQRDILTLFNSGLIYQGEELVKLKDRFEKINPVKIHNEASILPSLNYFRKRDELYVLMRNYYIPINELQRISFETGDTKTKDSIAYILQIKGDLGDINALKACLVKTYNDSKEGWDEHEARSYNLINYEDNKIVVFGDKETIDEIEEKFNELNSIDGNYKEDDNGYSLERLSRSDEEALEKAKRPGLQGRGRPANSKDIKEASEILNEEFLKEYEDELEIVSRLDGRQSVPNLEYDLRNHPQFKSFRNETSNKLFFLIKELEESNPEDLGLSQKKYIAFKNVLMSFKMEKELEEDEEEYLFEQLDEDDKRSKSNRFLEEGRYKTHRNYYNQVGGVLKPYGHPQITHRRQENPPSMRAIRGFRRENNYNIQNVAKCDAMNRRWAKAHNPTHLATNGMPERPIKLITLRVALKNLHHHWTPKSKMPKPGLGNTVAKGTREYLLNRYGIVNEDVIMETFLEIGVPNRKEKTIKAFNDIFSTIDGGKHLYLGNKCVNSFEYAASKINCIHEDVLIETVKELEGYLDNNTYNAITGGVIPRKITEEEFKKKYCSSIKTTPSKHIPTIPTRNTIDEFIDMSGDITPLKNSFKEEFDGLYEIINKKGDVYTIKVKIDGEVKRLYAKGNLKALEPDSISYAGTRKPSVTTKKYVETVVASNSQRYVIISGLAEGCDEITHQTCLNSNGVTIAVLPCGFNKIYPPKNKKLSDNILKKGGLLLSEYSPNITVSKGRLIERNKIISGLSDKVIIFEAGNGTRHTYNNAIKVPGKKVFVQPCNRNKDLKSRMNG